MTSIEVTTLSFISLVISVSSIVVDFELTQNSIDGYLFRASAAGIYQDKLIVLGGYNAIQQVNTLRYEYDLSSLTADGLYMNILLPSTSSSQPCPDLKTDCETYGTFFGIVGRAFTDDKLYFASIGTVENKLFIYDLSNRQWVDSSTYNYQAPGILNDHCMTTSSYTNKLYVFGVYGSDWTDDPGTNFIYDIATDVWSLGTNMIQSAWQPGCATSLDEQTIYILGGSYDVTSYPHQYGDKIQQYTLDSDMWTLLNESVLVTPRDGPHCVSNPFEDEIVCMGGEGSAGYLVTAEVFDVAQRNVYQVAMRNNAIGSIAEALWMDPTDTFGYIFAINQEGIQYTIVPPPTEDPTADPTFDPTVQPTGTTAGPTVDPTYEPTVEPTEQPTQEPTRMPTIDPTNDPTFEPTVEPTGTTTGPTVDPTDEPTVEPTKVPSVYPSNAPTESPSKEPSINTTESESVGDNVCVNIIVYTILGVFAFVI